MEIMKRLQIVINAHAREVQEIERTVQSLVRRNRRIWCLGAEEAQMERLRRFHVKEIDGAALPDRETDVVIVSPPVVLDYDTLNRMALRSRGLLLMRVLIPGQRRNEGVSYWTKEFLRRNQVTISDLAKADIDFDSKYLSHDISTARHWVRGSEVGADINKYSGVALVLWGFSSAYRRKWAGVSGLFRKRLGMVKRKIASFRHRRLASQLSKEYSQSAIR